MDKNFLEPLTKELKLKSELRSRPARSVDELKLLFTKVCVNAYNATETSKDGTPEPMLYRREDLTRWAREAFERGQSFFYAEPVNPKDPCGQLRLCEARYKYKLSRNLTESEYMLLFGLTNNGE